jgi:hypothetical protein
MSYSLNNFFQNINMGVAETTDIVAVVADLVMKRMEMCITVSNIQTICSCISA